MNIIFLFNCTFRVVELASVFPALVWANHKKGAIDISTI